VEPLSRKTILELFGLLNEELTGSNTVGEIHVVGGAVMCLALNARDSTHDVAALFEPVKVVREAARRVAARAGVSEEWLNDAVKGYPGPRNAFEKFLELSHLRVFVAEPHYLLAMKCASMRLGAEFHDLDDVRYLLRHLNIESASDAMAVVEQYVPTERIPPKTRYALEELLPRGT
jgi:hypothetical protein